MTQADVGAPVSTEEEETAQPSFPVQQQEELMTHAYVAAPTHTEQEGASQQSFPVQQEAMMTQAGVSARDSPSVVERTEEGHPKDVPSTSRPPHSVVSHNTVGGPSATRAPRSRATRSTSAASGSVTDATIGSFVIKHTNLLGKPETTSTPVRRSVSPISSPGSDGVGQKHPRKSMS